MMSTVGEPQQKGARNSSLVTAFLYRPFNIGYDIERHSAQKIVVHTKYPHRRSDYHLRRALRYGEVYTVPVSVLRELEFDFLPSASPKRLTYPWVFSCGSGLSEGSA